jgi:hypothetical protein
MSFKQLEHASFQNHSLKLTASEVQELWRDMLKEMELAYWRGVEAGEKQERTTLKQPLELRK